MTDYSENSLITSEKPQWLKRKFAGLPVPVLHIRAWDERTLVKEIDLNSFYTISDVKIVDKDRIGMDGDLKFSDRRVKRIDVGKGVNIALRELQK